MTTLWDILATAAPLLVASLGALVSEYAGSMAVFADGFISFGAFLCFSLTVATDSLVLGAITSILICGGIALTAAFATQQLKANPFLTGLALNLLAGACISLLSIQQFSTRGVLTSPEFPTTGSHYPVILVALWVLSLLVAASLIWTRGGTYLRITGSSPEVLRVRGIDPRRWQAASWAIAAACAAAAGVALTVRLGSFVPNISAGRGWTALAAVFLGRKSIPGVAAAALIFALAEYGANNIQRIPLFADLPSAFLLALPYLAALLLMAFQRKG